MGWVVPKEGPTHQTVHNEGIEKADCRNCIEDSAEPSFTSESESES